MSELIPIKRALISCWEKSGISELAGELSAAGVEIVSSGGTAKHLSEKGIPVTKVEEITGFPEMLDGRVKTLHPFIHGAILARRTSEHLAQLQAQGIAPFDLVVVNLYPFLSHTKDRNLSMEEMVELIDIGGPAMLRAAAKNFENVAVLHRPEQYDQFLEAFRKNGGKIPFSLRQQLATEAFFYSAYYDSQIAQYLDTPAEDGGLSNRLTQFYWGKKPLRYGENPHQSAALYRMFTPAGNDEFPLEQFSGKEMSFNNYVDVEAAYNLIGEFSEPVVAIIKHTNPCGVAVGDVLRETFERALATDPMSAFGGIIAANREIDRDTAEGIHRSFYECVIAPGYSTEALEILRKKKNLRVLKKEISAAKNGNYTYKYLDIGLLIQEADTIDYDPAKIRSVGAREPETGEQEDLFFAWNIVKHVKSNAIVFVKNRQLLGVGAGQMSRVDAVKLAESKARQAGHDLRGAVMASDAFFPFRDGVDAAASAGITAVIQPGGSIRDSEVIEATRQHGMAMLLTGLRHFKH